MTAPAQMRILHVTRERDADRRYGLGKSLSPVVDELRAQGHWVQYVCQSDLSALERSRMEAMQLFWARLLSRLPQRFGNLNLIVWAAIERMAMGRCAVRIAREEDVTHIHCHDPWIAAGVRKSLGNDESIAWGITQHGFGSYANAHRDEGIAIGRRLLHWLHDWERRTLERASWVIAPTPSCLTQLVRDLGLYSQPAHWHSVPHPRPAINHYEYLHARNLLGWKAHELHIVGVGRFALMKRFPMMIEACAEVSRKFDVRLTILGEGDPTPLLTTAQECGFSDRLTLTVTDDIGLYLAATDLYLSTSATESFGMANLEALVAGAPVICLVGGATADVIGQGGWLIPGDKVCLVDTILALLSNPAESVLWRHRSQCRGNQWPCRSSIAKRYADIYSLA